MAAGLLAFVEMDDWAPGPDPVPNDGLVPLPPETRKPSDDAGFPNGEGRNRTGDTTIFRTPLETL
jgi:hypothetical protein